MSHAFAFKEDHLSETESGESSLVPLAFPIPESSANLLGGCTSAQVAQMHAVVRLEDDLLWAGVWRELVWELCKLCGAPRPLMQCGLPELKSADVRPTNLAQTL